LRIADLATGKRRNTNSGTRSVLVSALFFLKRKAEKERKTRGEIVNKDAERE
jgi:hypothetical protein